LENIRIGRGIAVMITRFFGKALDRVRFLARAARMVFSSVATFRTVLSQGVKVIGRVRIEIRRSDGSLKLAETVPNLVVSTGLYHIADQMSDKGNSAMSHMAIGTGTTAAALSDLALETELDRNTLDSTTQGTAADSNKVTFVATWAAGDGTGAITEAGIFNQAGAGTMLCRTVFSVKNKGAGDSMTLTWTITFS
jgi:hypothetical protein